MNHDQTTKARPRCTFLMVYGGRRLCKHVWVVNIMAEASELPFGCPVDCKDYHASYPTIWEAGGPAGVDSTRKGG